MLGKLLGIRVGGARGVERWGEYFWRSFTGLGPGCLVPFLGFWSQFLYDSLAVKSLRGS